MLPNVVAKATVIPVDEEAIQALGDATLRPLQNRFEQRRYRQCFIDPTRVAIRHTIRLLPARSFYQFTDWVSDLVEVFGVELPKLIELCLV